MLVSASRRTDIPAFYADWFMRRLREGHVLVPNPWNPRQLGRLRLSPKHVDCIVFWTKNPQPMLSKLAELDALGYRFYFSFTITAYGQDVERNLPPKDQVVDTFRRLADTLGPHRVDWRFDPVAITARHPLPWHLERFDALCSSLHGYTQRCIMNFIKSYRHIAQKIQSMDEASMHTAAKSLAAIAACRGIPLFACSGQADLRKQGVAPTACIDREKIEALTGWPIRGRKDAGQPDTCRCLESVDIGMYGTCPHGCAYCYATRSQAHARRGMAAHDPASPMLCGRPFGDENVTDRTRPSLRDMQLRLV